MNELKQRWKAYLSGDATRPDEAEKAVGYRLTMQPGKDGLWPDIRFADNAADMFLTARRLKEMAIALCSRGAPCYMDGELKEATIRGLEWLYQRRYNQRCKPYGNWWYWEIGVPIALLESMLLLDEMIPPELIKSLLRPIDKYVGDPSYHAQQFTVNPPRSTGANLVWKAMAQALSAVMQSDEEKLLAARKAVLPVFGYTTHGDGFYLDGSFIQHDRYAYTGGYGVSLLQDIVRVMVWLHGTPWALGEPERDIVFHWARNAYAPLMFRGQLLDMTSGREISRKQSQNHESGHSFIASCLRLSRIVNPRQAEYLLSHAKLWIGRDSYKSYSACCPPDTVEQARSLLVDDGMDAAKEAAFCKLFASMDRAVLQGPGFAYGISMHSNRIGNYESMNGENLKSWYTAHGMTDFYQDDLGQYADSYWPTVNPCRLPGTTVPATPRQDGTGNGRFSSRDFVGGAVLEGEFGGIAMELEDTTEDVDSDKLTGRKSWFLLGDRIVALGSDIQSQGRAPVETIIENRMWRNQEQLIISAEKGCICDSLGRIEEVTGSWIQLFDEASGCEAGYLFPKGGAVKAVREVREGNWRKINANGPDEAIKRAYFTVWFDHGARPQQAEYAYILLPGRTASETERFGSNCPVYIREQSEYCHAVEDTELGVYAAHFWKPAAFSTGLIACSGRASIVLRQENRGWTLAVSDPTQREEQPLELEIKLAAGNIRKQSERITLLSSDKHAVKLSFDPREGAGASFEIAFES